MKILGIDPGLQKTGWGVISLIGSNLSLISCGVIKTDSKQDLSERLKAISLGISEVIETFHPDTSAIEETFVSVNASSTLKLGQARGAAMLTLALKNLPVAEYSATSVKKSIVGVGRAEKNQVADMVKRILCVKSISEKESDATDALAVAICHSGRMAMANSINERLSS